VRVSNYGLVTPSFTPRVFTNRSRGFVKYSYGIAPSWGLGADRSTPLLQPPVPILAPRGVRLHPNERRGGAPPLSLLASIEGGTEHRELRQSQKPALWGRY
jgi:hypothetical protein